MAPPEPRGAGRWFRAKSWLFRAARRRAEALDGGGPPQGLPPWHLPGWAAAGRPRVGARAIPPAAGCLLLPTPQPPRAGSAVTAPRGHIVTARGRNHERCGSNPGPRVARRFLLAPSVWRPRLREVDDCGRPVRGGAAAERQATPHLLRHDRGAASYAVRPIGARACCRCCRLTQRLTQRRTQRLTQRLTHRMCLWGEVGSGLMGSMPTCGHPRVWRRSRGLKSCCAFRHLQRHRHWSLWTTTCTSGACEESITSWLRKHELRLCFWRCAAACSASTLRQSLLPDSRIRLLCFVGSDAMPTPRVAPPKRGPGPRERGRTHGGRGCSSPSECRGPR